MLKARNMVKRVSADRLYARRQGRIEEFNLGKRSTFVLCNLQGPGMFSPIHYYYYYDHYEPPVVNMSE